MNDPTDHPAGVEAIYAQVRAAVGAGVHEGSAPPQLSEADRHIRALALRTPTLPPATHTTCYLVGATVGAGPQLVVDPATPYPDQQGALLAVLADEARAGREVLAVFLTHHHRDHVGAASAVAAARGVPIWAHAETAARLPDVAIARTIEPDEELVLGPARVRAVFTPGHAAGHLCLLDPDTGAMIAGDMVAGIGTILVDPSEGDMAQYLASLEAMLALAPRRLLPAHGPLIDDAPGKLREYLAHRRMREAKVLAAVGATPASPATLVVTAYADTPRVLWPLAERSLIAHLVKLARDGQVVEEDGLWRASRWLASFALRTRQQPSRRYSRASLMGDLRSYNRLHAIVLVREMLRRWWGLELAFADAKGYVLDHADGKIFPSQNELCKQALFSKEGFRRCNESVKVVGEHLRVGRANTVGTYVHQCHLGFDVVAAPLWFGSDLVGFLFTGGSWSKEPTAGGKTELLRKVREFSDLDGDAGARAIIDVPRMTEPDLERVRDLIAYAAGEVIKHWTLRGARDEATAEPPDHPFTEIVGSSPAMRELIKLLTKVVRSESTVLIQGESGTGKELIARAVHYHGPRAKGPFVVQNCSAFNDNLLESALFGHARGAFTGAVKDQKGLFEVADRGTFFLDEIGDMSAALQVKLLRVLQEGTFTPVGGTKPVHVDVRIIAASHKDLTAMVARREFREDLYYRVNVVKVTVPPLRERVSDIPTLAMHFLSKHHKRDGETPRLSEAAIDAMVRYPWPGNIRELENEIERAMVLGGDGPEIGLDVLSPRIATAQAAPPPPSPLAGKPLSGTLREVMESVEADVILQGLIRTHWNKSQLAKELGISRSYLIQKCTYYGLERKE